MKSEVNTMPMLDVLYAGHANDPYFSALENDMKMMSKKNSLNNTYPSTTKYIVQNAQIGSMHNQSLNASIPRFYLNLDCALLSFNDESSIDVSVLQYDENKRRVRSPEEMHPSLSMQYIFNEDELKNMIDGGFYENPIIYRERLSDYLNASRFEKQSMINVKDYRSDGLRTDKRLRIVNEDVELESTNAKDYTNSIGILVTESLSELVKIRQNEILEVQNENSNANKINRFNTVEIEDELALDGTELKIENELFVSDELDDMATIAETSPIILEDDELDEIPIENELDLSENIAENERIRKTKAVGDVEKPRIDSPTSYAMKEKSFDSRSNSLERPQSRFFEDEDEDEIEDDGPSF